MVKHLLRLSLLLGVLGLNAAAQVPDKYTNLKVLPPEIKRVELVEIMKGFSLGLGVRCSTCHMGEEGKPLSTYDFASDEKQTKRNARLMLQMVKEINGKHLTAVMPESGLKPITVTCYTCHRGSRQPAGPAPLPPAPPKAGL